MSDKDDFKAFFAKHGMELRDDLDGDVTGGSSLVLLEGSPKVDGYSYFYAVFNFDAAGKFIDAGVWE